MSELSGAVVGVLEGASRLDYFVSHGIRPDGRAFDACRPVGVSVGVLDADSAAGSALVNLGETRLLAAVTLQVGTPHLASPSSGDLGA